MITTERAISVNVRIFTKSGDQLKEIIETLRQDCAKAILQRKKLIEELGSKDIQIHITAEDLCSYCGKLPWDCECGKPNRPPLV